MSKIEQVEKQNNKKEYYEKTNGSFQCLNELPQPLNERAILTIKEVADFLRVHRTTVSGYAKSGELRSHKLKGRRLFKSVDVWTFFENQVDVECVSGKEDC